MIRKKDERMMVVKKRILLLGLMLNFVLALAACGDNSSYSGGGNGKITEVVSADKTCTIQVTDGWKDLAGKLHPDASLEVADMSQEKYVIVLMEAKEDFVDMDLVGYTDIVVNQALLRLIRCDFV